MDTISPDLDKLFEQESDPTGSESDIRSGYARCSCGFMFGLAMPGKCPGCGDFKSYWKTGDGRVLKLADMTIGHLTSSIKYLAEKMEKFPANQRERFEIALDLLYAELGSREKETKQLTGIQAALFKNL